MKLLIVTDGPQVNVNIFLQSTVTNLYGVQVNQAFANFLLIACICLYLLDQSGTGGLRNKVKVAGFIRM